MAKGCDTTESLSFAQLQDLKQQGYGFVARYINGGWKQMHYDEARRISDNSLYVVSLYQEYNNEAKCFSDQTGISQAKRALRLAASLKQPHDTPIYFAVDFDADADDIQNQIMSYFSGVSACFADTVENPNHYLMGCMARTRSARRSRSILVFLKYLPWWRRLPPVGVGTETAPSTNGICGKTGWTA